MKTQVIMKRELFGEPISQQSETGLLSANDMVRAGNRWRAANSQPLFDMSQWFKVGSTKEFVEKLRSEFEHVHEATRGRNGQTWVHPFLFIDMALAMDPALKVEVYSWMFDNLLENRDDSGDSYKLACASIDQLVKDKRKVQEAILRMACQVRQACGVVSFEAWQLATQDQLKHRDMLYNAISTISRFVNGPDEVVRLAIEDVTKAGPVTLKFAK